MKKTVMDVQNIQVSNQESTRTKSGSKRATNDDLRDKMEKVETFEEKAYKAISEVELSQPQRTLNLSQLVGKSGAEIESLVSSIVSNNKKTEKENLQKLETAFADFFRSYIWASSIEKVAFLRRLAAVRVSTLNFSVTFQNEQTEETTNIYENGAYFSRPTTATAAGLRTSFNSSSIIRTALNSAKNREEKRNLIDKVCQKTGLSQSIVETFNLNTLRDLAEKA